MVQTAASQVPVGIRVFPRIPPTTSPAGGVAQQLPHCCYVESQRRRESELSLHFQPTPPSLLGFWNDVTVNVPTGTHVATSVAR
jgi:hypothetical protein